MSGCQNNEAQAEPWIARREKPNALLRKKLQNPLGIFKIKIFAKRQL